MPLTRTEALKVALSFPDTREGPYFNKPAIFVGETFLTRVHTKEDAMVLHIGSMEMRDVMLEAEPRLFYITDHYKSFPYLLAQLSKLDKATRKDLLGARLLRIEAKTKKKKTVAPKPAKVSVKAAKKKAKPGSGRS